jgi:molybdate transport system substrate-binding protein
MSWFVAICVVPPAMVSADHITVLSAGAVEPGLTAAAKAFERDTGHIVKYSFDTAPRLRARITGGEAVDVVIAPAAVMDDFAKSGRLGQRPVTLGRVGIGVAVRGDAPAPDISTTGAFTRSLTAAESLVFNRASTGVYFETLLKKLGLYDTLLPRITRYDDGASVMEHLLKGRGREMGVGAITEIRLFADRGLRLVGPLPAAIQNETTYAVSVSSEASSAASRAFAAYLDGPAARALFSAAGIER